MANFFYYVMSILDINIEIEQIEQYILILSLSIQGMLKEW